MDINIIEVIEPEIIIKRIRKPRTLKKDVVKCKRVKKPVVNVIPFNTEFKIMKEDFIINLDED